MKKKIITLSLALLSGVVVNSMDALTPRRPVVRPAVIARPRVARPGWFTPGRQVVVRPRGLIVGQRATQRNPKIVQIVQDYGQKIQKIQESVNIKLDKYQSNLSAERITQKQHK